MSLFVSAEAAKQLLDLDNNPGLMSVGLYEILQRIDTDGIDFSSQDIHRMTESEEEIYVLKYHSFRLFLTKSEDRIVLMSILER